MSLDRLQKLSSGDVSTRLAIHREAWPTERARLGEITGRVLRDLLSGHQWAIERTDEEPGDVVVGSITPDDDAYLQTVLPDLGPRAWIPASLATASQLVDLDVEYVGANVDRGEVVGSGTTRLAKLVLHPILNELLGCWRVRTASGPSTLRGRTSAVQTALDAHATLGLDGAQQRRLLDPDLDRDGVAEVRRSVAAAWAQPPVDLGERAMLLLTSPLVARAAKKRRRDGTLREVDALGKGDNHLCEASVGGWDALVAYLGLGASASARPQVQQIEAPSQAPPDVEQRLAVLRAWWRHADDAWAAQPHGAPTLWGMTPEAWPTRYGDAREPVGPSFAGAGTAEQLWQSGTDARAPDVLVPIADPLSAMASLLGTPYRFWEGVALTTYYLIHGPYSRTSLEEAPNYYARHVAEMAAAGVPVDAVLWDDLLEAAAPAQEGLQHPGAGLSITISLDELDWDEAHALDPEAEEPPDPRPAAFEAMRDVVTRHRRAWMAAYLDRWLELTWRGDLGAAASAYLQLRADRDDKPPTARQAWPTLGPTANRWFGGDVSRLAAALNLKDEVLRTPPRHSDRALPTDVDRLTGRVTEALRGDIRSTDWPTRRRGELAARTPAALEHWVATGRAPTISGLNVGWLLPDIHPAEPKKAFGEFLRAVADALGAERHPAADTFRGD